MSKVDLTDFFRKMDALSKVNDKLPDEIAALAVNFSKERFREQAWLDTTKEPWKQRKSRRAGKKRSQTLLYGTGRLKRSIRKISADSDKVIIGTDVPYAEIHNNGGVIHGDVKVKSHMVSAHKVKSFSRTRKGRSESVSEHTVKSHMVKSYNRKMNTKIPARPFIGASYTLNRRIYLLAASRFAKALKQ
jgi:phage gpG-like protein